jgi:hypothetical protein
MNRPQPPSAVLESVESIFVPAPDFEEWIREAFVDSSGKVYNKEHGHLASARIGVLWTNAVLISQMFPVAARAELAVAPNSLNKWQKLRWEQQIREWFGAIPDFIHTYYAFDAIARDDTSFLALVDHELYHCAQRLKNGVAQFVKKTGKPKFGIKKHDSEEFPGVVRRFGLGATSEGTIELVRAAKKVPEIGIARISAACGTCLRKVA